MKLVILKWAINRHPPRRFSLWRRSDAVVMSFLI